MTRITIVLAACLSACSASQSEAEQAPEGQMIEANLSGQSFNQDKSARDPKTVETPVGIVIECKGTSRDQHENYVDSFSNRDTSRPDASIFMIDEEKKVINQFDEDKGVFVRFCGECKFAFGGSRISWSSDNIDKDENDIASGIVTSGWIDRVDGTAHDAVNITLFRDGKMLSRSRLTWDYHQCTKVDVNNLPIRKF